MTKHPNASHSFKQKQHALKGAAGAAHGEPRHPSASPARVQFLIQSIFISKTLKVKTEHKDPVYCLVQGSLQFGGVCHVQIHFWPQKQADEEHNQYGLRLTH